METAIRKLDVPSRIVFVHSPDRPLIGIRRILRSVAVDVTEVPALSGLLQHPQADLVLVDYDGLGPDDKLHLHEVAPKLGVAMVVVSTEDLEPDLPQLIGAAGVTNVLARNAADGDDEMVITLRKLLYGNIFGLEKYFSWGAEPRSFKISSSSARAGVLELAEAYAESIGIPSRLVGQFCSVADEFITNALFNAPVDHEQRPRFRRKDRARDVTLEPGEEVEIKFLCDGRRLGISASDSFGSLTREQVLAHLSQGLRVGKGLLPKHGPDHGGAGLGLYCIFQALSHFVVNLSPGRRTEMIGLIDVRGDYRHFVGRHKSFNLFVGE